MSSMKRKKIVEKYLTKLVNHLNLQDWEINVVYVPHDHTDNVGVGMETDVDISYLRSEIRCYPICDKLTEKQIKHILCHELCHIITEPMYSLCRANVNPHLYSLVEEQREQETERIARIALQALTHPNNPESKKEICIECGSDEDVMQSQCVDCRVSY